jgi:hypothetical protein
VLQLVTALPDAGHDDERALASVLASRGQFGRAAVVHDGLADAGADGDDRARATNLRARLN